MPAHVLIAVDMFDDVHLQQISRAVEDHGILERIPYAAPAADYVEHLARAEIVVGWPQAEWLLSSPVRLFQLPSAGYDAYLGVGLDQKSNFTLCNARGVMSVPVAEHCIALMLAFTRRIPWHIRDAVTQRWERQPAYSEVTGATACIVGLGDIGTELARRCAALGMVVTGVRKDPAKGHMIASRVYGLPELRQAVAEADHIFAIVPGTSETRNLFDAGVFDAIKSGAYFYNVARGLVVDESAMIESLRSRRLAGAGLDVFREEPLPANNPLWAMENVIITPHAGGRSVKEADRMAQLVTTNIHNYYAGLPLVNAIALQ